MSYAVRPIRMEDIAQASQIDREAFPTQWPAIPFRQDLNDKAARCLVAWEDTVAPFVRGADRVDERAEGGHLPRVASRIVCWFRRQNPAGASAVSSPGSQFIVGYAILRFRGECGHLISIAVRKSCQGQGIGELLLISVIETAAACGMQFLTLEVRVSNLAAQQLYRKYSFFDVRRYRGYYTDNGEDALIMYTDSLTSASYQAKFQRLRRAYTAKRGENLIPELRERLAGRRTS